jgi:hypothetical protein
VTFFPENTVRRRESAAGAGGKQCCHPAQNHMLPEERTVMLPPAVSGKKVSSTPKACRNVY